MGEKKANKTKDPDNNRSTAIVKRSSTLADVPLQNFNSLEINFFYGLLYLCQGKRSTKVKIDFDEFRELTGYSRRGDAALIEKLKVMSNKFASISLMETKKNGGFKIIVPFISFEADPDKKEFTVEMHEEFVKAINDLDGSAGKRYALIDVINIVQLKSTYSKQCLGHLSVFRNREYWETSVEELKYYLDIPAKYRTSDINDKVIPVIEREYEELNVFERFEITPRFEDSRKKTTGRRKTLGYLFSFKFNDDYLGGRVKGKRRDEKRETIECPICGQIMVKIEKHDGSGAFFGHEDGWKESAPCRFTINADKVGKGKIPNKSDNEKQDNNMVTERELINYYSYIREQEVMDLARRKDEIREREPEIWNNYVELEKMRVAALDTMTAFSFTEAGKSKKKEVQKEIKEYANKVREALLLKGYGSNYLEIHYKCPVCMDTGQKPDGLFCSCRAERIKEASEWVKKKTLR